VMFLPMTVRRASGLGLCYACSDSLLWTPLCCDDIHEVTLCVFALAGVTDCYVSLSRKKFCWETIFLIRLKCYRDPKEEPIGKETLMELKEIGLLIACRMLVVSMDPRSRVTLVKAKIDLRSGYHQLRECMKKIFQRLPLGRELLKKEKLFVKFSKCELWLQEVHILGHAVNSNGIHMDPSKIEAVKNWKVLKTLSGIRSFLGLAESRIRLCTHAKRQGRERDSRNAAWPGPTNGKEGRWRYLVHSRADKTYYDLRDMYGGHVWRRILLPISWWKIYFAALVDIAEGIENTAKTCDTHLPLTEFSIIIVIIRVFDVLYLKRCMEGSVGHMFFGLKLEKFGRLDQNWYKRQQIRVEVGDKVMLEVSSWKDVVHFGKKEMLAPRYRYLADTNLHVHLEDIKVDKTLRFVEEPVEIIDHEVKSLKRSRILIVKSIGTRSEVMRIS
ncbi:hypothetical protein Tco_1061924, partial [Tanacetum coccineum]